MFIDSASAIGRWQQTTLRQYGVDILPAALITPAARATTGTPWRAALPATPTGPYQRRSADRASLHHDRQRGIAKMVVGVKQFQHRSMPGRSVAPV